MDIRSACEALPLFPLPRLVLMPGAHLPLHVFEPRYRALVAWCMDEGLPIGVATIVPKSPVDFPVLYSDVGMGQIVGHQTLPDGRSNIVLHYVGRMRLEGEIESDHPFRVGRGHMPDDDVSGSEDAVGRLRILLGQLAGRAGSGGEALRVLGLPASELVHLVARKVIEEAEMRRRYLHADRLVDRVDLVMEHLIPLVASGDVVEVE